ncbi:hypothetical protein BDC45DRAFT_452999, partial [Circinella umbellata]
QKPILPSTAELNLPAIKNHNTESWITYLNHYLPILHHQVKLNIQKSQARQKKYYDHRRMERLEFQNR